MADSIDKGLALVAVLVVAIVGVFYFVVQWVIEDAVWDSVGQGFDAAGHGDLSFLWSVLGVLLTVVFVAGIGLALLSRLGISGRRGGL